MSSSSTMQYLFPNFLYSGLCDVNHLETRRVELSYIRWTNSVLLVKVSVYRVETWLGDGPYGHTYGGLLPMHAKHYGNRPEPQNDGILALQDGEVCGFGDRADLDWWFKGFKRMLYREGFNIARYVLPGNLVRYGSHQLVFDREDYLPVERYPVIRNGILKR